ncbi:MAG TPA: Stk1 family PASTA domain-containing Ser/Thr kinase [Acidothermaceae bacterium]|nr:Stk1 family PASTA domain-containing Ser/Thr kinase [Acidothermaceae bacterium]
MDTTMSDALVGRVLDGRYRVEARIARGGMATVYRALDTRLDRVVALKVMHQLFAENDQFVARFNREAKSAARLSHPNVVAVYDQGEDDGYVFLAMEYVQGRTLRDLLRERTRLTPQEALSVFEPVLAALSAAHAAGLVHRDVKPENVLLADDGRVKVADFGLARAAANLEATSATSLIGTVAYLSPEQVIRGIADERSDVYSAGVMLFEMLTGRPPYDGETAVSVALKHAHEDVPPPSSLVSGIPTSVDLLVAKATARDPDRRPHDAGAFLAEVVRVRGGLVVSEADDGNLTTLINRTLVVELPDTRTVGPNPPWQPEPPEPPEDEYRRPHPHRKGWIAFFIIVLLAAAAAAAGWWFAAGRWTSTPNLTKLSSSAAMEKAKAAHVTVQVGAPEFSSTVPKDAVVEQSPTAAHKVLRGDTVTIRLSQGPQLFQVPKYDPAGGTSLVDYKSELSAAHLNIADPPATQYSPTVIAGNVISVEPAVGQNEKAGTTVTVTVSLGPQPIQIVDYTGQPADQATTALTTAGFNVVPTQDYSTTVKAGSVISQSPNSGTGQLGNTITLDISKGPQLFKVPDVTSNLNDPQSWTSIQQATKTLTDAGFKVKVGASGRFGVVTKETPNHGTMQPLGTVITIYAQ